MNVEEIQKEFNKKLELRDSLKIIEEEMQKLEELDIVQKYLKLQSYYNENIEFANKKDDELLNMIIDNKHLELKLHDCYFCLGKNFKAKKRNNGEYYLISDELINKKFNFLIDVGVYRSFENPEKTVIVPQKEIQEFEKNHPILFSRNNNIEEEYLRLRRIVVQDELDYLNKNKVVRN